MTKLDSSGTIALRQQRLRGPQFHFRYTFPTVRIILAVVLVALSSFTLAGESSFQRVKVPDAKGRPTKAVLTFRDDHQSVEIQPAKGPLVAIPYRQIDKFSYEYTRKHRVNESTIAAAPIGVGALAMLTRSRIHWLEIDYRERDVPKLYVLRMDKHEYLRILDAVKAHTGKDAEVLGNADKRKK
jgi:hypothetical protein